MQSQDKEIQDRLIQIFSLPFSYEQIDAKRCLHPITQEELKKYQLLANATMPHALKLLVEYKKADLKFKGINWNATVSSFDHLAELLTALINTRLEEGQVVRQQIIVICQVFFAAHYTILDVEVKRTLNDNRMSIAAFDAVDDGMTYKFALIPTLKGLKSNYPFVGDIFFTCNAIQNDLISCPIFAFHLAKQLATINNLHAHLKEVAGAEGEVPWSKLPISLLKQAQSRTLLAALNDRGPCNKKQETTLIYFKRHSGFFSNSMEKERNFATVDLYLKYAAKIIPIIKSLTTNELQEVLAGKSEMPERFFQCDYRFKS